jgi:hypothetical protein
LGTSEPTALLPGLEIHRREFRLRYGTGGVASARRPVLCLYFFELLTHAEAPRSLLLRGLHDRLIRALKLPSNSMLSTRLRPLPEHCAIDHLLRGLQWCAIQLVSVIFLLP